MLHDVLLLVGGGILLVAGAYGLVQGGSSLARRIGISPLWVGLTVVAIGTSAPELAVSVMGAVAGSSGVAVGNVVGSNILNVLVVLGVTALILPVSVRRLTVRRDISLLSGISLVVLALSLDGRLHWAEGAILFLGIFPYMVHVYREEKRGWVPTVEPPQGLDRFHAMVQVLAVVVGVAILVVGARAMVLGGTSLAVSFGIPDRVIGLTVIAVGTSLPELATSLVAAYKRQVDLAVGNVVGSNILNLLLVLGGAVSLGSLDVDPLLLRLDMPLMVLVTLLLWRFAATRGAISRTEGALLIGVYLGYIGFLLGSALA